MNKVQRFGALSSSSDPEKLGNTVRAGILASATTIIFIGGLLGFEIAQNQIAEVATQLGFAVSSIWFFYGLIQKAVIWIQQRYFPAQG